MKLMILIAYDLEYFAKHASFVANPIRLLTSVELIHKTQVDCEVVKQTECRIEVDRNVLKILVS